MKKILTGITAIFILSAASSCSSQKPQTASEQQLSEKEVTGTITAIENGKDGYMATVTDKKGQHAVVTISIVNLQKSGGTFKRYAIGDVIGAKGTFWKDDAGIVHITASSIEQIK
ncbi:hypothetical protein [Sphingobacterium sp.]|uniref:hypothetical protein n=1 Tax=Sphingobacterium sp. TaxID=341027 RepID=UPI0028AEAADE|nr:hypothetical protein [Sphingobacterium sp.]